MSVSVSLSVYSIAIRTFKTSQRDDKQIILK